jgi:hypothetical protein
VNPQKNFVNLTIHVAKATSFALFSVVQTTSPVDGDVTFVAIQTRRALHTATSADTAEFKETVEYRAIITDIVPALFL